MAHIHLQVFEYFNFGLDALLLFFRNKRLGRGLVMLWKVVEH